MRCSVVLGMSFAQSVPEAVHCGGNIKQICSRLSQTAGTHSARRCKQLAQSTDSKCATLCCMCDAEQLPRMQLPNMTLKSRRTDSQSGKSYGYVLPELSELLHRFSSAADLRPRLNAQGATANAAGIAYTAIQVMDQARQLQERVIGSKCCHACKWHCPQLQSYRVQ
jgi:hypothetical protein